MPDSRHRESDMGGKICGDAVRASNLRRWMAIKKLEMRADIARIIGVRGWRRVSNGEQKMG